MIKQKLIEKLEKDLHDARNNFKMSCAPHKVKFWGSQVQKLEAELQKHQAEDPYVVDPYVAPGVVGSGAGEILAAAAGHLNARAVTYDKPEGERSMGRTVELFNLFYGTNLTEDQGWRFMVFLKMVRSTQGAFKQDNHEDAVAYEALAAEFLSKQGHSDD